MSFVEALPTVNATLNAASGVLVFSGWRSIRRGRVDRHKGFMLAACGSSTLFLVCYLTRVALTGPHRFPGDGLLRAFYLVLLASHTLLATVTLPMVVRTVYLSLSQRLVEHRRIARWTFPIWMYVSVTGVVVYAMLYHVAPHIH